MRDGHTQSFEVLFAEENQFEVLGPVVKGLRANRDKLVDSDKLFKVVSSFVFAQTFLVTEKKRKAQEGSKRWLELQRYGYVPKPASTAIRLCESAIEYFKTGVYGIKVPITSYAAHIKFNPSDFTPDDVERLVDEKDKELKQVYEASKIRTKFDEEWANHFLLCTYLPYLTNDALPHL